jgi:hypothetical protein
MVAGRDAHGDPHQRPPEGLVERRHGLGVHDASGPPWLIEITEGLCLSS